MYSDNEQLEQHRAIWLTKEVYAILRKEKGKFKKIGRNVSMAKILNNLVLEKYEHESMPKVPRE